MFNLFKSSEKTFPKYKTFPEFEKRTAKELEYVTIPKESLQELTKLDFVAECVNKNGPAGKLLVNIIEGSATLHFPDTLIEKSGLGYSQLVAGLIYTKEGKEVTITGTSLLSEVSEKDYTWSYVTSIDGKTVDGSEYELGEDFGKFLFKAKRMLRQGNRLISPLDEILA